MFFFLYSFQLPLSMNHSIAWKCNKKRIHFFFTGHLFLFCFWCCFAFPITQQMTPTIFVAIYTRKWNIWCFTLWCLWRWFWWPTTPLWKLPKTNGIGITEVTRGNSIGWDDSNFRMEWETLGGEGGYLSVLLSVGRFVCVAVWLSGCPSVRLSVRLSVYESLTSGTIFHSQPEKYGRGPCEPSMTSYYLHHS